MEETKDDRTAAAAPAAGDTLVLTVAYDGAGFSGFAAQERQTHVRTVAGELTRALRVLMRRDVALTCAGRTDAGVHARSQVVSVPLTAEETARLAGAGAGRLMRSLDAILPDDVSVRACHRARPGFSARFDALARTYRYRIAVGPRPVFGAHWAWWLRGVDDLDLPAMRVAAGHLVGEHDFKTFCKTASAQGKPTCRHVEAIDLTRSCQLGEDQIVMQIVGNAFLHNMVRAIMGTLVEVGRGRRDPDWVAEALRARDRSRAGQTAPACGLTFWDVRYPSGSLRPW